VYNRLQKLVRGEWKTHINAATDESGMVAFRGFHGRYAVALKTKEGKLQSFEAVLLKDQDNNWEYAVE
jgi:hypothetical protein